MNKLLRAEQSNRVLRLTLDDPHSRNSLSTEMMAELIFALTNVDDTVSVIILAANGPAFCSGHNLKQLTASRTNADKGESFFKDTFKRCSELMLQISQHRCVIIAEVAGLASAAGCQLVATCDLAYAGTTAKFCTPGVNIGLFCSTPMTALSRNLNRKHSMEMLLTGDVYDATYAHRVGLINNIFETEKLSEEVARVAEKIAKKSAVAISYGKKLFRTQLDLPLQEAYEQCSEVMVANMLNAESIEGIGAFLEKRAPNWKSNEPR